MKTPALVAVLVLAAALRFTAIGWGLRHTPHVDERYFVENTGWMLAAGDLDHRFYEYPGLFFYFLAPILSFQGPPHLGAPAYLAGRTLVAAFGCASVALVFLLGRRMSGSGAGLAAALLLAVSPVEVHTAHMIRPDVVLEAFVLASFLVFDGVGLLARRDAVSGAAIGAAVALKFSGILLAPCYALKRVLAPGPRLPRLLLAAVVSLLVFAVLSPYSLVHLAAAVEGARTQVTHHYVERGRGSQTFFGMAWTYGGVLVKALGAPGMLLAAGGALVVLVKEARRWAPLLAFPVLTVAVFSTAEAQRDRFMVPALGILALLAGRAVSLIAQRSPRAAVGIAVVAAVPPLLLSVDYVAGISKPATRDLALEWIEIHAPAGARILTTARDLGLDRRRYEVLEADRIDDWSRRVALDVDYVVTGAEDDEDARRGLTTLYAAEPSNRHAGPRLLVAAAAPEARPPSRRLALAAEWLNASESLPSLPALVDGDPETTWRTAGPQQPGTWIEVTFPQPAGVSRIELRLGRRRQFGGNIHVLVTEDGSQWRRVTVLPGRPPVEEQVAGDGPSQVLILEPMQVRGVRLVQMARRERPWAIAELEIEGPP